MDFVEGQRVFRDLLNNIDRKDVIPFLKWVMQTSEQSVTEMSKTTTENTTLNQIRSDLKKALPVETVLKTEKIIYPTSGDNSDCISATTVHVDGFLYDEEAIDDLVEAGKLSRNYCKNCGSHQVAPLTFISHSTSCTQLLYIFCYLLPNLQNKLVLDVGSRLGPVLYGAYLYTDAAKIIGVEMNPDFCELQQKIIESYHMQDRVQVICDDICNQTQLVQNADVIIMNNVFEFFVDVETQKRIWTLMRQTVRKRGACLVVSPSLESSLLSLQMLDLLHGWVQPVNRPESLIAAESALFNDVSDSDLNEIYLYNVL